MQRECDYPERSVQCAQPTRMAELCIKYRLPLLSSETGFAQAGGLMNYGDSVDDAWRRSAAQVDRILKGARPADLPIEQSDQVRAGHQPQDRQGPRPDHPAVAPAAGGPGD